MKVSKEEIAQKTTRAIEPFVKENGMFVWDAEFKQEGTDYVLRVMIEKKDGVVSLDDCEQISRELNLLLDREDEIEQQYYLEVTSPGIERKLKEPEHFLFSVGKKVSVKVKQRIGGEKKLQGILQKFENETLFLETEKKEILTVAFENVDTAKIIFFE